MKLKMLHADRSLKRWFTLKFIFGMF